MSKAILNEQGVLVNAETGEPIGKKNGNNTTISSALSEGSFSLDDYGVNEPDFPEEKESESGDYDEDFSASNAPSVSSGNADAVSSAVAISAPAFCAGPTSYNLKKTKYEVTENSFFVIEFGLLQKSDGRFVTIGAQDVDFNSDAERHWVKFRMWNYNEELKWKSEFLEYNNMTKSQFLNVDKLNERKIKNLMLDWSFGENEDRLKLLHCDGRLSDESYAIFMGMYPSIANTIVDMMNAVLENNQ